MATSKPTLIVPVEIQTRELDAKLLFSCVAAERGYRVIFGSQTNIHLNVTKLPRGTYVAKDMLVTKVKILDILRKLGHGIIAWDEEGLVRKNPEQYYNRISERALERVSTLFAWGPSWAEILARYPAYSGTPIEITGNPRIDMLREDLRNYYDVEVDALKDRFGDFILVNSNFGKLNHYSPKRNILVNGDFREHNHSSPIRNGDKEVPTDGPTAATDEFNTGLTAYRQRLFDHFRGMVVRLGQAFPDYTIVLRPHPSENHGPWLEMASRQPNLHVACEGNVVPWLMASRALVHNSCTTGVESFLLDVPTVVYQPIMDERFDLDFPNSLGCSARETDEVVEILRPMVRGRLNRGANTAKWKRVRQSIAAFDGRLASDRIVDVIEQSANGAGGTRPDALQYIDGWLNAKRRTASKRLKSSVPGRQTHAYYQRHRFPGVSVEEVQARIGRFQHRLERFEPVRARQLSKNIFEISAS